MRREPRNGAGLTARISVLAIAAAMLLSLLAIVPAGVLASGTQFGPYQVTPVGSEAEAVAIGDVTSDGIADVVLTTGYANTPADFGLFVFAGLADGTLAAPVTYATAGSYGQRPETVDIGDVNGDGRPDVVVGLSGLGIQLFAQAADGTLAAPVLVPSVDSHKIAVLRHVRPERWSPGSGGGPTPSPIFADTGAGLAAAATYPAQHDGWDDLEAGDVTGDGRTDIVVMSGQGLVPNVSVLPALADGTFGPAAEYAVGGNELTQGIGVGDVTGDGRNDVVASYGGNSPTGRLGDVRAVAGRDARRPAGLVPELRHPGRGRGLGRRPATDGPTPSSSTRAGCGSACTAARPAGSSRARTCTPCRTRTAATRTASPSATSPGTGGRTS